MLYSAPFYLLLSASKFQEFYTASTSQIHVLSYNYCLISPWVQQYSIYEHVCVTSH